MSCGGGANWICEQIEFPILCLEDIRSMVLPKAWFINQSSPAKQVDVFPYLKTKHLCVLLHYLKLPLV